MTSLAHLRVSCKQGRLMVGDSRINLRGNASWELERSKVAGVCCVAGLLTADLAVMTRDEQRLPLEGMSFHEALRVIEMLGYLAAPEHCEQAVRGGSQHLEVACIYSRSKLVITSGTVSLTGTPSWTISRGTIASVSCASGEVTACVTIHTCTGRHLTVDGLPFNGALRILVLLGTPSREVPAPDPAAEAQPTPDPTPVPIVPPAEPPPAPTTPPASVREPEPAPQPVREPSPMPQPVGDPEPALLFTSLKATALVSDNTHQQPSILARPGLSQARPKSGQWPLHSDDGLNVHDYHASPPQVGNRPVSASYPAGAPGSASVRVNTTSRTDGAGQPRAANASASTSATATLSKVDAFRASIRDASTPTSTPGSTPREPESAATMASRVGAFSGARRSSVSRRAARGRHPLALVLASVASFLTLLARQALAWLLRYRIWCGALARSLGGRSLALVKSVRSRVLALLPSTRTPASRDGNHSRVLLLAFPVLLGVPVLLTLGGSGGVAIGNSAARAPVRAVLPVRPDRRVPAVRAARSSGRAVAQATGTGGGTNSVAPVQQVFVGSHDGSVYALAASDGHLVWRFGTGGAVESSPTYADGVVYFGSDDHYIYALRASDHATLWRFKTGSNVAAASAVADGVVYTGSNDDYVYALRASDGMLLWRFKTRSGIDSRPAVADGIVVVGSEDHSVYALRATDGALLWWYRTGDAVSSSPTIVAAVVYVGSADNGLYALRLANGSLIWRYETGGSLMSAPAVVAGVVYVGSMDDAVYALRASDGALLWRYATHGLIVSSPGVVNGTVYVGSYDGAVYALRASDGAQLWRYSTGGPIASWPALRDGTVYIGSTDQKVYALDASSGQLRWWFTTGGVVS